MLFAALAGSLFGGSPAAPDLLFVQSVLRGTFENDRLVIENADMPVLFFMERPGRVTGQVTAKRFLELWTEGTDSFKVDPPNAVLAITSGETMSQVVLELTDAQAVAGGVSYAAKVLAGHPPARFGPGSLFIDSFPGSARSPTPATPALTMDSLFTATSQALGNAAHNAVPTGQNSTAILQASTTQGVAVLYGKDTASTAVGIDSLLATGRK